MKKRIALTIIGCLGIQLILMAQEEEAPADDSTTEQQYYDPNQPEQEQLSATESAEPVEAPASPMPEETSPAAPVLPAPITPVSMEGMQEEPDETEDALMPPQETAVEYGEGVDTLNISGSGNWLLKRVWWEKGQAKFESIKATLEKIFDARMDFFFKRSAIDKEFNAFYLEIGFAQGELDEILQELLNALEKQPEEALNDAEREMLVRLHKAKKEVEQLKQDIATVTEIDNAIDGALTQMIDQINKCRKYEHEAWLRFKAIAQEIDDEKARELYYHMEALQENMQDVYAYLRGEFANYFNDLLEKGRDHMAKVKTAITQLKEQGIALEKKTETVMQEQPEQEIVVEQVSAKPKKGITKYLYMVIDLCKRIVQAFIKGMKGLVKGIMAAVRGKKVKKARPVELVEEEVVTPKEEPLESMPVAPHEGEPIETVEATPTEPSKTEESAQPIAAPTTPPAEPASATATNQ